MSTLSPTHITLLNRIVGDSRSILVVSHLHPDGDATGCVVAMGSYLRSLPGRSVTLALPDREPGFLSFISESAGILHWTEDQPAVSSAIDAADLIICLDFNSFGRSGDMQEALAASKARKVLIDHHLFPDEKSFDLVFSDPASSSACELLFQILCLMPDIDGDASRLPLECATALMTGMTTDTNNFANSVRPQTLDMASRLLAAGVDRDSILQHLYFEYRPNRILLTGHALSEKLVIRDGFAYIILDKATQQRFDLIEGETEGLVNIALGIKDVRLSMLFKEDDGFYRVSLRSKEGTSARNLAAESFHGGGHERASGGRLYFPDDIAGHDELPAYIEKAAARFVH